MSPRVLIACYCTISIIQDVLLNIIIQSYPKDACTDEHAWQCSKMASLIKIYVLIYDHWLNSRNSPVKPYSHHQAGN
jgi:hypothetical protein